MSDDGYGGGGGDDYDYDGPRYVMRLPYVLAVLTMIVVTLKILSCVHLLLDFSVQYIYWRYRV